MVIVNFKGTRTKIIKYFYQMCFKVYKAISYDIFRRAIIKYKNVLHKYPFDI